MPKRREFIKNASLAAGMVALAPHIACQTEDEKDQLEVHIFSKHLQFLDYNKMANAAKEIGFDGVELTVRSKGHVLPENAKTDLPKAIAAIKQEGLKASMIVTGLNHIETTTNREVLETAASLGVRSYRLGYYRYPKKGSLPDAISSFKEKVKALALFNEKLGLQGTYQNHAGKLVGASMWEIWQLLEDTEKKDMACQYDIRHALVEGGKSWENGLRLIQSKINCIVAKDFRWEKIEGEWKLLNVPLGEGMVDFVSYFKLLKNYGIKVPATLHLEYPIAGAEHGDKDLKESDHQIVFEAMKRDLNKLHEMWKEA